MDFKKLNESLKQFLEGGSQNDYFIITANGKRWNPGNLSIYYNPDAFDKSGNVSYCYNKLGIIPDYCNLTKEERYKQLLDLLFKGLSRSTGNLPFDSVEDEEGIILYQDGQRYY